MNAQSPFNKMGQHLGFNQKNNVLSYLINNNIIAENCLFRLIAYGPILEQAATLEEHIKSRDTDRCY